MALALLTGLNLCNYLDRYILPSVLTPLEHDLGINDSEYGTIATVFMVGYFLTAPFFGYLGDRCPRRWLIALGVLVWCAGTALSGTAHGLAALVCFRILVGVGEASYGTLSPGWIADLYSKESRNNALSFFYIAIPVGSALGFIVGGAIAAHWGWRAAFYVAGVPGLLLALALLLVKEPERGSSEGSGGSEGGARSPLRPERPCEPATIEPARDRPLHPLQEYLQFWKMREYRLTVLGYVAQTFAMGGFANFAAAFLERNHHMSFAAADSFFGLSLVVTGLLATVAGGLWGTAWRKRSPAGYSGVLAWSAALAIPASFAAFMLPSLAAAKVCLVAAMFLLFLSTGPVNTLILETVPVARRAAAMAASIFAIHLFGDLWSPKILGWLSVRTGDLKAAILWTLPPAIILCAGFWGALAILQSRKAIAAS